ncbi:MAG: exodeoxyribonuclease V subunit alpha [Rhodanobacteraceae bacterium]|nr:MAG: exodeoxyribonuclease V subunit alpha [Rhodanobacteraceae bacterium]
MSRALDTLARSGRLRRADAALGAWLARMFPDAAPEVALAAALAARAVGDGHSALELAGAQAWCAQLDGHGAVPALPDAAAWQAALHAAQAACKSADDDRVAPLTLDAQGRVYLSRYHDYERQVATTLAAHARRTFDADAGTTANGTLDAGQQHAVAIALRHGFALVTGGPGSGKTYSVARMLAALLRDGEARGRLPRIALAAPTGKAAARLTESLHAQIAALDLPAALGEALRQNAVTLHNLLGISPWRAQPRHHTRAPLPYDVVVVDEASMIDLPLMAKLVGALRPDTRLMLLGDPDQLSAVEAGNVLPALVEASRAAPFDDCHAALARSHRFGAGSALGKLAASVVAGDADAALALLANDGTVRLDSAREGSHAALVATACTGYADVLAASDVGAALRAARGFRVLTALRHGPLGCLALNRDIEARLVREHGLAGKGTWWRGRLVLVTANRAELGLFNGDVGVAWPDADGGMKVWFEGAAGPRAFATAALPPHEGAFALTVHKAQGSEFERVALVTGPDSAVLTRELLYTGVTRARTGITLYSDPDTLRAGIGRRTLRMTGLADRLREAAAAPSSIAESLSDTT